MRCDPCRERLPAGSRSCIAGLAKRTANGYFRFDIGAPQGPRGGVVTQRSANSFAAVTVNPDLSLNHLICGHSLSVPAFLIRFFPGFSHRVR